MRGIMMSRMARSGSRLLHRLPGRDSVGVARDRVALLGQREADGLADVVLVVDQGNAAAGGGGHVLANSTRPPAALLACHTSATTLHHLSSPPPFAHRRPRLESRTHEARVGGRQGFDGRYGRPTAWGSRLTAAPPRRPLGKEVSGESVQDEGVGHLLWDGAGRLPGRRRRGGRGAVAARRSRSARCRAARCCSRPTNRAASRRRRRWRPTSPSPSAASSCGPG